MSNFAGGEKEDVEDSMNLSLGRQRTVDGVKMNLPSFRWD